MRISDWSSDVCSSDLPQRALAMACALCGVSLDKADPRIWDARELGLFDSLPSLRVQATNILGKHDLLDNAREPSALVPATAHKASDYGRLYRNSSGEAMIALTPLGRSVFDAIDDIELDEHAKSD